MKLTVAGWEQLKNKVEQIPDDDGNTTITSELFNRALEADKPPEVVPNDTAITIDLTKLCGGLLNQLEWFLQMAKMTDELEKVIRYGRESGSEYYRNKVTCKD